MNRQDNRIYTTHGAEKFLFFNGRVDGKPALVWHKEGREPAYILVGELTEEMKRKPYMELYTSVPK